RVLTVTGVQTCALPISPLVARVVADGTYLRAMLGSASLLVLVAGAILGVAAIHDTGGDALPPAASLTIAIAMLGVLDAAAGLLRSEEHTSELQSQSNLV